MLPSTSYGFSAFQGDKQQGSFSAPSSISTAVRNRLLAWQRLIASSRHASELVRLERVNRFLNQLHFVEDRVQWARQDYWATPVEFLSANAGDCEDFAIAKYFTLRAMGFPASQLRMMYVKALDLNQAHMVLAYYPRPESDPLILDNLTDVIQRSSQRNDLLPIYSFNADSLWLQKTHRRSVKIGEANRISLWRDLAMRMAAPAAGISIDALSLP